jgi:hypothetical protein
MEIKFDIKLNYEVQFFIMAAQRTVCNDSGHRRAQWRCLSLGGSPLEVAKVSFALSAETEAIFFIHKVGIDFVTPQPRGAQILTAGHQ